MEPTTKKIKGYTGSKSNPNVGGAMTGGGITQNGVDFTVVAPKPGKNVYGGGAATNVGYSQDGKTPITPSVLTDANIRETVIPEIRTRAQSLLDPIRVPVTPADKEKPKGPNPDQSFENIYSNFYKGSIDDPNSTENSPETSEAMSILGSMRSENDAVYNSTVQGIASKYSKLEESLKKSQEQDIQGVTNSLIRNSTLGTNASRYNPIASSNILKQRITSNISELADLADKEASLIIQAQNSRSQNNYRLLEKQLDLIEIVRKEKNTKAQKISDEIAKQNKEIKDKEIQASRDNAIAGIVQQGITDPKTILELLNFNEQGNIVGDFTVKEIGDTLKIIAPGDDLDKLSGTTRDFFILKGTGNLPENITSLPEDQQLFAYLQQQKIASTKATNPSSSKNKITLSEAKSKNLPLATVGMSEDDIAEDLQGENPPPWFTEKIQTEQNQSLLPEVVSEAWQEYRTNFLKTVKVDKKTTNYNKASQYFGETYEGLTEEELDSLATEVETRVNGGLSYADAIQEVIDEL